jgi:uncharacterized membrane protein
MVCMLRASYVWDQLRGSFWFVPTLLALVAGALAFGLLFLDHRLEADLPTVPWLYTGGAEGARSLLAALAGSVITVIGLSFTMTTVALQLAAAQLGPRLLRNFVRDPGNQVVLGTFVGTFIYCLIVLRAVRGTDGLTESAFVPHLSVTGAVVLALLSVAVLIYFIHHAAVTMQADEVLAAVMRDLHQTIRVVFPQRSGDEATAVDAVVPEPPAERARVLSADAGYVQTIDDDTLVAVAAERDIVVAHACRPGDFVAHGDVILEAWPLARVDGEVNAALRSALRLGVQRTMVQDVRFGLEQLTEVAANALSSNLRDPITALRCVDRLGEAIDAVASRPSPSAVRRDAGGVVRLVAPPPSLDELVSAAFDVIRAHARSSRVVCARLLETFERLARKHRRGDLHAAIVGQALAVLRASDALDDPIDRAAIRSRFDGFMRQVRRDVVEVADATMPWTS